MQRGWAPVLVATVGYPCSGRKASSAVWEGGSKTMKVGDLTLYPKGAEPSVSFLLLVRIPQSPESGFATLLPRLTKSLKKKICPGKLKKIKIL